MSYKEFQSTVVAWGPLAPSGKFVYNSCPAIFVVPDYEGVVENKDENNGVLMMKRRFAYVCAAVFGLVMVLSAGASAVSRASVVSPDGSLTLAYCRDEFLFFEGLGYMGTHSRIKGFLNV